MKSLNIYVENIDNVNIKSLSANERFNFGGIYHYNDMANMLSLSKIKYYNDDKTYIILLKITMLKMAFYIIQKHIVMKIIL